MLAGIRFLVRDTMAKFGLKAPVLFALMVLSGLLEGLAVTMALPLLASLGAADGGRAGILTGKLAALPGALGLPGGPVGVGILMIGLVAVSAAAFVAQARMMTALQARYVEWWQVRLFDAVMRADLSFVQERRSGDITHTTTANIANIGAALFQALSILATLASLTVYMTLAFLVSPRVSLVVLAMGVGLFTATRPFIRRAFRLGSEIFQSASKMQSMVETHVAAAKLVKTSAAEDEVSDRFKFSAAELSRLRFAQGFEFQLAKAVFEFGGASCVALLLIGGPLLLGVGVSTVLVVLALFVRLLPRLTALQQSIQSLNNLLPSLTKVREMLREAVERAEPHRFAALPPEIASAPVPIRLVDVRVQRGGRTVLDAVSVDIPGGAIVAFVGPTGSGKSTLVDVVLGLVPLESGHVEIAGRALDALPLDSWRRAVGYVGQDAALIAASIADNVRFGNQADEQAIAGALERAAADFVGSTSDGVRTLVGERGVRLSGGERQRLAIARAMAAPRRLYVLDEATSALDSETEARIIETIAGLPQGATVLIVAHRFSAVKIADIIHVVEDGRIVESGDWAALDRPGRRFHSFRTMQDLGGEPRSASETAPEVS